MPTVFANGRSILHAGDGLQHVAAPPDVCKTPSPGGPVPIPYVNMAMDGDLAQGAKQVKIEGKPVALESSNLGTSTGDEPGTAGGGLMSSKTKGKMTWATASADVKFEGKGVTRFMDVTQHNGNSFNTAFQSMGGTGLAYADDFKGVCAICSKGPKEHRVIETPNSAELCGEIIDQLLRAFTGAGANQERYARLNKRRWSGYMIGVMVCKCEPPKTFAAMSGETLEGFEEVARKVVDRVIGGAAVSFVEMVDANSSKAARRVDKKRQIGAAWLKARENRKAGVKGYNPPGNCAGAKLMARAGHAPLEMTERYFMPPTTEKQWSAEYRLLKTEHSRKKLAGLTESGMEQVLQNEAATEKPDEHFVAMDQSVASCHTCQELLFMTNCPKRSC